MKNFAVEIKWGIRYIFAYLAWIIMEKSIGIYTYKIDDYFLSSLLFYAFGFLIYILAINDKKKHFFNNNMDWKQGCVSGIFMSIVIAILMPVCQVVIHQAIAPEFFPNMIKNALASGKNKPEVVMDNFNLKAYIYQSVFFSLSIGVVYSAIVSSFLKTKNTSK